MQEHKKIEEATENIKEYMNIRYELMVLKASDRISFVLSKAIVWALRAWVFAFCILFLSFAAAHYLSAVYACSYSGFLVVGGIYFSIGLLLVCIKKSLAKPLRNKIISNFFKRQF